jgi:SOS-response transcriptional repressor LexA
MTVKQGAILRQIMSEKGVSVSEMARRLDLSRAAINNYSNTETFQDDVLDRILQALGLDKEYFLNYKIKKIDNTKKEIKTIPEDPNGKKIPFAGDVYATISEAMADVVAYGPQTFVNIPIFSQGEFALQASGHSMKGYINQGDWIVVKRINNRNALIYGECYVVVTKGDNLKTVKFVKQHKDDDKLLLVPYNTEQFEAQSIAKEDVIEIYSVVGLFRKV